MTRYRKRPVVVEATQWFKNGDHPKDHDQIGIENPTEQDWNRYHDYLSMEGQIVRYYRHPNVNGNTICDKCSNPMHDHGWIDTLEGGNDGAQVVCPGDWIITGVKGEYYPCKPDIFPLIYEPDDIGSDIEDCRTFVRHIENHLKPGQEVVCKICNRTMRDITR